MTFENTLPTAGPSRAKTTMTQTLTITQAMAKTRRMRITLGNLLVEEAAGAGVAIDGSFPSDRVRGDGA